MASPPQPAERRVRAPGPAAESVDILRKIFLLLDCPADLARACAASPAFRRVITDPDFLHRFRALHPPPLLGICNHAFLPAEPPHPSAAVARKFVDDAGAIDFTCKSFLPGPGPWDFCDSRDGRTLLTGKILPGGCCESHRSLCRPLAVCDPLHRRYVLLPAIPEDLAALVDHGKHLDDFKPFLAPPARDEQDAFFFANPTSDDDDDDDDDGEKDASLQPSYRVMCLVQCGGKLSLFVFSSSSAATGLPWHVVDFDGWNALGNNPHNTYSRSILPHNYAHGRFYWTIYPGAKKILVVDARRSRPVLSIIDSPPDSYCFGKTFVEAAGEQERLAMVRICKHDDKHQVFHLSYALLREEGWGQWEPEAIIYLPLRYNYYRFIGVAGGYLLLEGTPEDRDLYAVSRPDMVCFSLDLRTLQLERFCGSKYTFEYVSFYTGCPRYLWAPTV